MDKKFYTTNSPVQAEAQLQTAKRCYLEHSLVHAELTSVLSRSHTQPSTHGKTEPGRGREERGTGRALLAAGEAQHCLRLHPEASLLGLSTEHLRMAGGRTLSGVLHVLCVCVCVCVCVCMCAQCVNILDAAVNIFLQASKEVVLAEIEERLKAKCLRLVQWYSDGRTTGR